MLRVLRLALWALVLLLTAGAIAWATNRDDARALARALVIGSTLADVPGLSGATRAVTRDPVPLDVTEVGGLDARATRPGGDPEKRHPAVVLLVPRSASAEELAGIADGQAALARAGMVTWSVRMPAVASLDDGSPAEQVAAALEEVADDELSQDGEVAVVGAGPGGSIAILAAADERLDGRIRAIVAVQPYADVQGVLRLVVTGTTRTAGGRDVEHEAGTRLQRLAAYSVVQALERNGLDDRIADVLRTGIRASDQPLAPLVSIPARALPDELRPVRDVLDAEDPEAFDAAWRELPGALRTIADERSPTRVVADLDVPITLVVPEDDSLLPAADAERIAALAPDARVVRTRLIDPGSDAELTRAELEPLLGESVDLLRTIGG